MRGTTTQRRKRGDQHTGRRGRGARCHSAAPRRSRKPHPPRIDIDLSEGETLPLVVVENLSRLPDREDAIQGIALPPLEARLQKRYLIMVQSHLRSAPELAAGVASLPSTSAAFAATQATWRFLNNQPRPEAVVLGRPPEGAVYVRLPPLGAWSWSGPGFSQAPAEASPLMTNSRLIQCHARVLPSPDQNGKSTPDRSKLFGSHGQRPWF